MKFKIVSNISQTSNPNQPMVFLCFDNWNDFSYRTLYHLYYSDAKNLFKKIGSVKIGYYSQVKGQRKLNIDDTFDKLDSNSFSLGQSDSYYENLNSLGDKIRDEILEALNDIAKFPDIFNKAFKESVTRISLMRSISITSVTGQFRRLASGGVKLTDYRFKFSNPKVKIDLDFEVEPDSIPPTNIHVLIGRNGVGKTYLISNMIDSILDGNTKSKNGWNFQFDNVSNINLLFANLISITFSAFDETEPRTLRKDNTKSLQYSYIGLKGLSNSKSKEITHKSTLVLNNEFIRSLEVIKSLSKIDKWRKCIEMLESDPIFKDAEIKTIFNYDESKEFSNNAFDIFKRLSSGHKIVLLTITRLIETLQEKSLVIIDEPEAHLHPPLLSAFTRTLSNLLIDTNGVAIIATHSPVVLQEVPRSCIWKLRRMGSEVKAERLEIESFGENVGILTKEIFGLEVTNSGYYKLIREFIEKNDSYDRIINKFNNKLGMEARAIIMSLINNDIDPK